MDVTIGLDEEVVRRARELAAQRQTTLNSLIDQLLEDALPPTGGPERTFRLMDLAEAKSLDGLWRRGEIYHRRGL